MTEQQSVRIDKLECSVCRQKCDAIATEGMVVRCPECWTRYRFTKGNWEKEDG
jgi:hypothetical protein